jgi:hypothetical protein
LGHCVRARSRIDVQAHIDDTACIHDVLSIGDVIRVLLACPKFLIQLSNSPTPMSVIARCELGAGPRACEIYFVIILSIE